MNNIGINNMNNNNDNIFNPLMINNQMQQQMMAQQQMIAQQQMMQQQMMAHQKMIAPQQMMEMQNTSIEVIFRQSGQNQEDIPPKMVQCNLDDKVSSLIEKYRIKSGDRDTTKKFVYNAKILCPSLTLREAGIAHRSNIFVVSTKRIKPAENDSI